MTIPRFEHIACVASDTELARAFSGGFALPGHYLALFEPPRLLRPDARNEVIRLANSIKRTRADRVVLLGVDASVEHALATSLGTARLVVIRSRPELERFFAEHAPTLLQRAPRESAASKAMLLDLTSPGRGCPSRSDAPLASQHLVVCERSEGIVPIIAANYAHAINASLAVIPEPSTEAVDALTDELYTLYSSEADTSPSERLINIQERLRACLRGTVNPGSAVTFFTRGVPYGLAIPDAPTTHVFSTPQVGLHLADVIASELNAGPCRLALAVGPETLQDSELLGMIESAASEGAVVKALLGEDALVRRVAMHHEVMPCDLVLFSSHCGDLAGWRMTYKFQDAEGGTHTFIQDEGIAHGSCLDDNGMLPLQVFARPVEIDGVAWADHAGKEQPVIVAALDALEAHQRREGFVPSDKVAIPRVQGAAALKMADGNYMPIGHSIASGHGPVVLCNACSSWHVVAPLLVFQGARSAIVTAFDISHEAAAFSERLPNYWFELPLAEAVWRVQSELFDERRPYLVVGPHFVRLRRVGEVSLDAVRLRLQRTLATWENYVANAPTGFARATALRAIAFLRDQLDSLAAA